SRGRAAGAGDGLSRAGFGAQVDGVGLAAVGQGNRTDRRAAHRGSACAVGQIDRGARAAGRIGVAVGQCVDLVSLEHEAVAIAELLELPAGSHVLDLLLIDVESLGRFLDTVKHLRHEPTPDGMLTRTGRAVTTYI